MEGEGAPPLVGLVAFGLHRLSGVLGFLLRLLQRRRSVLPPDAFGEASIGAEASKAFIAGEGVENIVDRRNLLAVVLDDALRDSVNLVLDERLLLTQNFVRSFGDLLFGLDPGELVQLGLATNLEAVISVQGARVRRDFGVDGFESLGKALDRAVILGGLPCLTGANAGEGLFGFFGALGESLVGLTSHGICPFGCVWLVECEALALPA